MDDASALVALRALSHEHRLCAFRALVQAGEAGLAVGELREMLELPAATLTSHLNVLRAAGLVDDEREGRVIRIRAAYDSVAALIDFLTANCCGGAPCRPVPRARKRTSR